MSKKPADKKPTDAELAILGVIWERGSATVREVYRQLAERQDAVPLVRDYITDSDRAHQQPGLAAE